MATQTIRTKTYICDWCGYTTSKAPEEHAFVATKPTGKEWLCGSCYTKFAKIRDERREARNGR